MGLHKGYEETLFNIQPIDNASIDFVKEFCHHLDEN